MWEVGEGYPLSAEHEVSLPQVPRDRELPSTEGQVQKDGFCPHHPGSALSRVRGTFLLTSAEKGCVLAQSSQCTPCTGISVFSQIHGKGPSLTPVTLHGPPSHLLFSPRKERASFCLVYGL